MGTGGSPVIERITDGLNPQQRAAVVSEHAGPLLVLAGAGCGKTTVLTRRIAFTAATLCEQDRILALTFTRKAAEEMALRVRAAPGIDTNRPVPLVTTFHGFGLRILRERFDGKRNFERLGHRGKTRLIPERERLKMLAGVSTARERQALEVDLIRLDDLLSTLAVHPAKLAGLGADRLELLQKIGDRLRQRKREGGWWDFSDIVGDTLHLFETYQAVREHYASLYHAVLVDEFQDTNPLQIRLLNMLCSRNSRLFAVGDDDQAIYGFRGADIGPILGFVDHFPGATVLKLEINYRSTPAVLAAANRIFGDKPALYRKVLRSGAFGPGRRSRGPKPRRKHFDTQQSMVAWIANTIEGISRREEISPGRMAVLFRTNETLEHAAGLFDNLSPCPADLPQLLTVHRSKGLEFYAVFLCDLEEEVFPSYRKKGKRRRASVMTWAQWALFGIRPVPEECDLGEEKRLFYVGVTRAQHYLFLLSAANKYHHRRIRRCVRSRFLRLV